MPQTRTSRWEAVITSVGNSPNFSVLHLLAAWWSAEHYGVCDMAHESILALEFDGPDGLTGKMQSEGHGLCCVQPAVPPDIFDTSFVSNQVGYNTAAFSHAQQQLS